MQNYQAIYTALDTPETVAANGAVPIGAIVRKRGCGINVNGNGLAIFPCAFCAVDVNINLAPTAAGAITATLLQDGVKVPGAVATQTAAAAGDAVQLVIPAAVRIACNSMSTLTVVISADATVNSASMRVIME